MAFAPKSGYFFGLFLLLLAPLAQATNVKLVCPCTVTSNSQTSVAIQAGVANYSADTTGELRLRVDSMAALRVNSFVSVSYHHLQQTLAPGSSLASATYKTGLATPSTAGNYYLKLRLEEKQGANWVVTDSVRMDAQAALAPGIGESSGVTEDTLGAIFFDGEPTITITGSQVDISLPKIVNNSTSFAVSDVLLTIRQTNESTPFSSGFSSASQSLGVALPAKSELSARTVSTAYTEETGSNSVGFDYFHLQLVDSAKPETTLAWQTVKINNGTLVGRSLALTGIDFLLDTDGDGASDYEEGLAGTGKNDVNSKPAASFIDTMVIYSQGVPALYAGEPSARIDQIIAAGNVVLTNSGVDSRLRLVHTEQRTLANEADTLSNLLNLMDTKAAPFADLDTVMVAKGADVAVLMLPGIATSDLCGLATLGGQDESGDVASLTTPTGAIYIDNCPDTTSIHEIGHIMGLGHSRIQSLQNKNNGGTYPWSVGYGVNASFHTIMAYASAYGDPAEVPYFSSPSLTCESAPCGVALTDTTNGADAARSLRTTHYAISRYNASVFVAPGNTAPTVTITAGTDTLVQGGTFVDAGATATDTQDGTLTAVVTGTVNTAIAATYTLTYTATDSGGLSATATRTVTITAAPVVNTAPVITVTTGTDTIVQGATFVDAGATGTDTQDGTLNAVVTGTVNTAIAGTYTLTYTATDSGGLEATATRTVTVTASTPAANTAPSISLNTGTDTLQSGATFVDAGATATDAETGNLTSSIVVTGAVNAAVPGTYSLTYTVTDAGSLSATVSRQVIVQAPAGDEDGDGVVDSTETPVRLDPSNTLQLPGVGKNLTSPSGAALAIPSNATALALNVTAVNPSSAGFITVWPCGLERPLASNVNYDAGGIVPNGVIAAVGVDGKVCFYSLGNTDIIVDVTGWFAGTAFEGATPKRLADTRDGTGGQSSKVVPAAPLVVKVTNIAATTAAGVATTVPASTGTVSLNVTVVTPAAAGFLTVYPCDVPRPNASNVNFVAGQVIANGVIASASASGEVCVYSSTDADVVVDLAGWFPGTAFTGATPVRLVDTREGLGATLAKLTPAAELSVPVRGIGLTINGASQSVPATATAVALNVTTVNPEQAGFVTVWPCSATRPNASNLNFVAGQVVANNVIASIGDAGDVCVYTNVPSDIIVDVAGYFSGDAANAFVGTTPKRLVDTRTAVGPQPL